MWNHGLDCFGEGSPMMIGGGILMYLFWGLVIILIISEIRKSYLNKKGTEAGNAIEVLRKRYSMGEISTEEYRERLSELTKK